MERGAEGGHKEGESEEAVSGAGGSLGGGKAQTQNGESVGTEGGDVGVLAEAAALVASPAKASSPISVSKSLKTMSHSNTDGIGVENTLPVGQVSFTTKLHMPSVSPPYNPTKLLVFNLHGTLLDTSLLTSPNPNPKVRVTKKITTRRFVF